jgi:hypothetical protein
MRRVEARISLGVRALSPHTLSFGRLIATLLVHLRPPTRRAVGGSLHSLPFYLLSPLQRCAAGQAAGYRGH